MKEKILAFLITSALLLGSVCASVSTVEAADQADSSGTTTVTATVDSTYVVSIPAALALTNTSGSTFSGSYTLGAYGNVADNKKLTITPSALELTNTAHSSTKVDATVTQGVTEWSAATLRSASAESKATIIGNVSVILTEAGSYTGDITFDYGLTSAE